MNDFDNDGFNDLVVGAPGESPGSDPQSGFAFVFSAFNNERFAIIQGLDQEGLGIIGTNEQGDLFGSSLV